MSKLSAAMAIAILVVAGVLVYRVIGKSDNRGNAVDAAKTAPQSSIETPQEQPTPSPPQLEGEVFADGKLASGLDMGVNSEKGCTDWVTPDTDGLKLAYPGKPRCGAWGLFS